METFLPTPACETCTQSALAAALTQDKINLSAQLAQATATADILRAQALATANAAASTQGVALTQAKVDANARQAQALATDDIARAQALATVNAAAATESAAATQAQFNANALQAQSAATAELARVNALAAANAAHVAQTQAVVERFGLQLTASAATEERTLQRAAGTGTAIAVGPNAASAVQVPPTAGVVLWMWLTPSLIIVGAVLALWGATRWLNNRRSASQPLAPLNAGYFPPARLNPPLGPASAPPVVSAVLPPGPELPQPAGEVITTRYPLARSDSWQVRAWLAEVKRKLLSQGKE